MILQIEQTPDLSPTQGFWIIVAMIAFAVIVCFIIQGKCKEVTTILDENDPMNNSARYIFKHPCGTVVSTGGEPIEFSYTEAKEFAEKHPYYYTRRFCDTSWKFAGDCFDESKTI